MNKFSMTCSCGHVMPVEADTRDEAVAKLKGIMTEEEVAKHMAEKHPGQAPMSMADVHAGIEKGLQPA